MSKKRSRFSPARQEVVARRQALGRSVADCHDGVARRVDLRAAGLTVADIRSEVEAGRWARLGRHTIGITVGIPEGPSRLWWAVWESGPGAVLDGESALVVAGLKHWTPTRNLITVSLPNGSRVHPLPGVRRHTPRRIGPTIAVGLPRTVPVTAAIRAAQQTQSDRQAATLLAMTVQQRLVRPDDLLARWQEVRRSPRRSFLTTAIRDICDGAQSLGELDFTALCREHGLPPPSRQVLRQGMRGVYYLDVYWEELGLHLEIDGFQHQVGIAAVDDAVRQNEIALDSDVTLRIPVLGLRTQPQVFLEQVARGLAQARARQLAGTG